MESDAIQVRNLTKKFKDTTAVNNISFDVKSGEIFGLLGSNGAGKTTTFNILMGLLIPTEGEVRILGMDSKKDIEKIREEIAIVPQEISLYEELSVYDNLKFFGKIYAKNRDNLNQKIEELFNLFNLTDKKNKSISQLSGGYQRRVSIAAALLSNPKILLLDEPTSGIDSITNQIIMDYIKNKIKDTSIIITTHSIKEAEKLCDTILFMHGGKALAYGKPSSLSNQYAKYSGEKITIQFEGELSKQELEKIIFKYKDYIKTYTLEENYFIFYTVKIGEISVDIINSIRQSGIKITDVNIEKPGLESVFKYLIETQNDI